MTKVSEGKLCFTETPFLQAYKNGGIIVLEEFNLADPAVIMGGIGQAIVPPFILYEDGYRPVNRHPLCVIAMTMNSGTQGASPPNEALSSRAPITLVLDDPPKDSFIDILVKNSGCEAKDAKAIYGIYRKVQDYLANENMTDIGESITLRHCLGALTLMKDAGLEAKEAVKHSMIGAIAVKDRDAAKEVYDAVVDPSV
jgi:MoxR-like ATPase